MIKITEDYWRELAEGIPRRADRKNHSARNTSRDHDILNRVESGQTLKQIAEAHGVHRERMRQIMLDLGIVTKRSPVRKYL